MPASEEASITDLISSTGVDAAVSDVERAVERAIWRLSQMLTVLSLPEPTDAK